MTTRCACGSYVVEHDACAGLERELDRCNKMYRKLDIHSLDLTDSIRKLNAELQRWKEYAQRLETAGDAMEEFHSFTTTQAWRKAKGTKL